MENPVDPPFVELPREEQLVRLYDARDRIERCIARRGVINPRSEAERHYVTHGHRLTFGCCRESATSRAVAVSDAARATCALRDAR